MSTNPQSPQGSPSEARGSQSLDPFPIHTEDGYCRKATPAGAEGRQSPGPSEIVRGLIDLCLGYAAEGGDERKAVLWDEIQERKAEIVFELRRGRRSALAAPGAPQTLEHSEDLLGMAKSLHDAGVMERKPAEPLHEEGPAGVDPRPPLEEMREAANNEWSRTLVAYAFRLEAEVRRLRGDVAHLLSLAAVDPQALDREAALRAQAPASSPRDLEAIGQALRTQDNRCTDQPLFVVERKRRDYGYDPVWGGDVAWLSEGVEVEKAEADALEAKYQDSGEEPEGYSRTAYVDRWEFVTACFTEQGCKDFIAIQKHNLGETRIYAHGSFRNKEWRTIREFLLSGAHPPKDTPIEAAGEGERLLGLLWDARDAIRDAATNEDGLDGAKAESLSKRLTAWIGIADRLELAKSPGTPIEKAAKPHPAMLALEGLTPGGSEYVGDIARCVEYVRDVINSKHQMIIKLMREKNAQAGTAIEKAAREAMRYLVAATEPLELAPGTVYREFYHDTDGGIPGAYNANFYLWCIKKARASLSSLPQEPEPISAHTDVPRQCRFCGSRSGYVRVDVIHTSISYLTCNGCGAHHPIDYSGAQESKEGGAA